MPRHGAAADRPGARYTPTSTRRFVRVRRGEPEATLWSTSPAGQRRSAITYVGHSTYVIDTPGGVRIATDFSGYRPPRARPAAGCRHHRPGAFDAITRSIPTPASSMCCTARPNSSAAAARGSWTNCMTVFVHQRRPTSTSLPSAAKDSGRRGDAARQQCSSSSFRNSGSLCHRLHLGHLHHRLEDHHITPCDRPSLDIVTVVPIDGGLTISLDGMSEMAKRLRSSVVLPMHRLGTPMRRISRGGPHARAV